MCDMAAVQRAAFDRGFYELVLFIEEHRDAYWDFILTGRVKQGGRLSGKGEPPTIMYTISPTYLCHIYASGLSG
jgi:hypothetical protein